MNEFFMLDVDTNFCAAEAWINGIPVARCSAADGVQRQFPVHEYLIAGINKFQLVVEPGPTPSRAFEPNPKPLTVPGDFFARMRFMRMPAGTFPEDPRVQTLFDLNYRPPAGTILPVPAVLEAESGAPPWASRPSWLDAQPVPDTPASRAFVANFLTQISQAMNGGDVEPYLAAARIRAQEVAAAYQLGAEAQMESFRAQFKRISARPGFQMAPIVPDDLDLRWCGGGRVIDCVDKKGQPVLRSAADSNGNVSYRLPAKVAFFNRELHIVR